jgi:hypothetical protein
MKGENDRFMPDKTIANVGEGRAHVGNSSYGKVIANTDGGQISGAAAASLLLMR